MKADTPQLLFKSREDFRAWLSQNAQTSSGVWLVFGKSKAVVTLSANDALEEALCFGWIDGQMQSVDEDTYIKYFKQRGKTSNWSEKNKSLTQKLESQGLMTDLGRAKIEIAKQNGIWDATKGKPMTEEQVQNFEALLKSHETAWANFEKMPRSSRTAYTASYIFTKTEDGRQKRLNTIIERLILNLNPMESMKNKK
ncbi:MAG: YdeI/OmpD-associated family protein [Eubacteriales bacterium]|nr:YdeI/OmpD-associated family protein [Eubacteriales bacterium]